MKKTKKYRIISSYKKLDDEIVYLFQGWALGGLLTWMITAAAYSGIKQMRVIWWGMFIFGLVVPIMWLIMAKLVSKEHYVEEIDAK